MGHRNPAAKMTRRGRLASILVIATSMGLLACGRIAYVPPTGIQKRSADLSSAPADELLPSTNVPSNSSQGNLPTQATPTPEPVSSPVAAPASTITAYHSALRLEPQSNAEGAAVMQNSVTGTVMQNFRLETLTGGRVRIISLATGKCLFADAASHALTFVTCSGVSGESFAINSYGDGTYEIQSSSSHCLDVTNSSRAAGTVVSQNDCSQTTNQRFAITNIGTTSSTGPGTTPYFGAPLAVPSRIRAENFDKGIGAYYDLTPGNEFGVYRSEDVDVATCRDVQGTDCGYAVKSGVAGEWLTYTISIPTSGTYVFTPRFSTVDSGARLRLELDGVAIGTIALNGTGTLNNWVSSPTPVRIGISSGVHVLKVVWESGSFWLDYVDVTQ